MNSILENNNPQSKEKVFDLTLINKYRNELMGFAALWIYVFHLWQSVFANIPVVRFGERFFTRIGFGGVDIFFLLSGIGLTFAIKNSKSLVSFYGRRIKKIILPFLTMGFVYLLLGDGILLNLSAT